LKAFIRHLPMVRRYLQNPNRCAAQYAVKPICDSPALEGRVSEGNNAQVGLESVKKTHQVA
jgi:hypothetical protein